MLSSDHELRSQDSAIKHEFVRIQRGCGDSDMSPGGRVMRVVIAIERMSRAAAARVAHRVVQIKTLGKGNLARIKNTV